MKLNGNAIRPGNVIEHKARLWVAVKISHVKPGKGGAFAQVELRDIRDGRFRSSVVCGIAHRRFGVDGD